MRLYLVIFILKLIAEICISTPEHEETKPTDSGPIPYPTIDMNLTSSKFWDDFYKKHGFYNFLHTNNLQTSESVEDEEDRDSEVRDSSNSNLRASYKSAFKQICSKFFAVWPSDCADRSRFDYLKTSLRLLDIQMGLMNSSFTLFITSDNMCEDLHNSTLFPTLSVEVFDARELLIDYGFGPVLNHIISWGISGLQGKGENEQDNSALSSQAYQPHHHESKHTVYARYGDILRVCLAHRYRYSYMDIDISFLYLNSAPYLSLYTGAAVYSQDRNNIEITNSAFCLSRSILKDIVKGMISRINYQIESNNEKSYFYTEFGPAMFHRVLFNRHSVKLFSQNNPSSPYINNIGRSIHQYGHLQLHLTGHVRDHHRNPPLDIIGIVQAVRQFAGFPLLPIH